MRAVFWLFVVSAALGIVATVAQFIVARPRIAPAVSNGRADQHKQATSRPAPVLPGKLPNLNGRTVMIEYEVAFADPEPYSLQTFFLVERLEGAGAKVVQSWANRDLKSLKAGDVLVLGSMDEREPSNELTAIDDERRDWRPHYEGYQERKQQIAAEATAAGVQVILGEQISAFFGLSEVTRAEFARYEEKVFEASLQVNLPPVKFDGVGLADAIDFLRDVNAQNILVNWNALKAAGVDKNAPVTINVQNETFAAVLRQILDSAGGEKGKLAYEVDSCVLTISTARDLLGTSVSRTYDVRFLVPETLEAGERDERVKALLKLVVESIDPPSWGAHRGEAFSVMESKGNLIVVQTEKNQVAIESLIKHLQELMEVAGR